MLKFNFSMVNPALEKVENSFLNHVQGIAWSFVYKYSNYLVTDLDHYRKRINESRTASDILFILKQICLDSHQKSYAIMLLSMNMLILPTPSFPLKERKLTKTLPTAKDFSDHFLRTPSLPGTFFSFPLQETLEKTLMESATCVIFIGPSGFSLYQKEETCIALEKSINEKDIRVIPVLLPGGKREILFAYFICLSPSFFFNLSHLFFFPISVSPSSFYL